jgi:ATP-dependent DNA helicase RecG
MNLSELHERIARWEDLHTEFKEWPVHPDDLAANLVAFANTDGGQLIFGVADSRVIVGVEDPDRTTYDVDKMAVNNCEPPITVIREAFYPSTLPHNKPVVVVNIPKGDMRPYRTNLGIYYIRTTSGRRQASR